MVCGRVGVASPRPPVITPARGVSLTLAADNPRIRGSTRPTARGRAEKREGDARGGVESRRGKERGKIVRERDRQTDR